ncbi:MAG: NUDIX hydrolase [Melioribacteraceae bacterium]|nr:NUDIX hydrolase [Melioribacteraceae bacterium]
MALKKWKRLSKKVIYENGYWSYHLDKFEIDGGYKGDYHYIHTGGYKGDYHYIHTGGSTMSIPITKDGHIILINQYRYLNQKECIEFPCGAVVNGLSIEENAIKELREETGYTANQLEKIGEFAPYSGVSDEITTIFLATNLKESPLPADPTEQFEILKYTFEEVQQLINENIIWDGLTLAAWSITRQKIKELFNIK